MHSFSKNQILAIQSAGKTKDNLFITGAAGTGKSRVLDLIKQVLGTDVIVVSVTGMSASQVGGFTVDTVFYSSSKPASLAMQRSFNTLIIEEVSMVSKATFEHIDTTLQLKLGNISPMGGVRLIVLGDFYQLPPLSKVNNKLVALPYAYESSTWKQLQFKTIELKTPMRCSDTILPYIRLGQETEEVQRKLLSLTISKHDAELLDTYVHIFFSRSDAEKYNTRYLSKLSGKSYAFKAVFNDALRCNFSNVPSRLVVKVGSRVMCIKNDSYDSMFVANGQCGIVTDIVQGKSITVKMDDDNIVQFTKKSWYLNTPSGRVLAATQVPLTLAWGMTINKAQGLTLHSVVAHLTNDMYPGQAYVAISRVRTLDRLRLVGYKPGNRCINAPTISM